MKGVLPSLFFFMSIANYKLQFNTFSYDRVTRKYFKYLSNNIVIIILFFANGILTIILIKVQYIPSYINHPKNVTTHYYRLSTEFLRSSSTMI
jgi:hypothetical protein